MDFPGSFLIYGASSSGSAPQQDGGGGRGDRASPSDRLASKFAILSTGIAAVTFWIVAYRRADVQTLRTVSTVGIALVMMATYLAIYALSNSSTSSSERGQGGQGRNIHFAHTIGWIVAIILLLAYIFRSTRAVLSIIGIVLSITAAMLAVGRAETVDDSVDSIIWTRQRVWKGLAILAYFTALLILAWSLRYLTDVTLSARVVLALLSLYPLVYLSRSDEVRETCFALLDTTTVVSFGWLTLGRTFG